MTTLVNIPLRDKVRSAITNLPVYHNTKDCAFRAICEVLAKHGYSMSWQTMASILNIHDRDGRRVIELYKDGDDCASDLVFSWYTQCTGRVELTTYIS